MRTILKTALGSTALAMMALPAAAQAAQVFTANLTPSSGMATFTLDGTMLDVNVQASGLDDGMHLAHLHGLFTAGGAPANSTLPTIADDGDGDGFVELGEAAPKYGNIILNMNSIGAGATIDYMQSFDLTDPNNFGFVNGDASMGRYDVDDLIGAMGDQFTTRELIVHGQDATAVGAGTAGEVDGTAGFKVLLPTLGGEVTSAVPEPATWLMLLGGFGAIGGTIRSRKRREKLAFA